MAHLVTSETFICPKCQKEASGACVGVIDFLVCTDCYYKKYQADLEPVIIGMLREYFNGPEKVNEDIKEVSPQSLKAISSETKMPS